jgi:hypothetical protein
MPRLLTGQTGTWIWRRGHPTSEEEGWRPNGLVCSRFFQEPRQSASATASGTHADRAWKPVPARAAHAEISAWWRSSPIQSPPAGPGFVQQLDEPVKGRHDAAVAGAASPSPLVKRVATNVTRRRGAAVEKQRRWTVATPELPDRGGARYMERRTDRPGRIRRTVRSEPALSCLSGCGIWSRVTTSQDKSTNL